MDDDDDYFTPTVTSSRRLAMLFGPEEMISGGSSSNSLGSSSSQFKFVAPKQQRPIHANSSGSALLKTGQPVSGDGQEVLLKVSLMLLPQGTERNDSPKTQVSCQVVGSVAQQSFSLVVAPVEHMKRELWRAAIDSHLTVEVVDHMTVKVTAHTSESLTLLGEAQQVETLVTQVAICRGVVSSMVTHQDLHTGRGHVLTEGDVAKVSCTIYAISARTYRGEKVEELKGVKVTVNDPATGSWESCLAGAAADSHRLVFIPKYEKGNWDPPAQYYDVKVAKVKSKGGREKAVAGARSGSLPEEQLQVSTPNDAPLANCPSSITEEKGELGNSLEHNAGEEEDKTSRKAALVTRMAQVGTQIFPLLPSARPVPQSLGKPQVAEKSKMTSSEVVTVSTSTSTTTTPTPSSANLTPATSTPASTLSSSLTPVSVTATSSMPVHTTTTSATTTTTASGIALGTARAAHLQAPSESQGIITLAHSISQLDTSVAKIADRVEMLLAKVERVEAKSKEVEGGCVPETLMVLANGLVAQNKSLKTQLEAAERRLVESQSAQASLLTMNTQLLEEKKEMLRKEDELRKEVDIKDNDLRKERSQLREPEAGLMPKKVQSLVKATLNGLFHHMASDFSEETSYSHSQIFQTLRSGFETAYSSFVENLEKMAEEEEEEQEQEQEEEEKEQEELKEIKK